MQPSYPLTTGLSPKLLGRAVEAAVERAPALPEWHDPAYLAQQGWPTWHDAVTAAHRPQEAGDLAPTALARRRLAFDELLATQLAVALVRAQTRKQRGRRLAGDGRLRAAVTAALPFALTASQTQTLAEIDAEMTAEHRMLRLLQGDVGSGKTVLALMAMLSAVEGRRPSGPDGADRPVGRASTMVRSRRSRRPPGSTSCC